MPFQPGSAFQKQALFFQIAVASCLLVLAPVWGVAQTQTGHSEQGQAIIRNYNSREYSASAQNWAVLQDNRGMLYVGNNECLLEYDGHTWSRINGTNGGVFSLAADTSGTIYVGGAGDFGYLQTDPSGARRYISLSAQLPESARNFGVVRSVHMLGDTVFFQSRQTLFLYHQQRLDTYPIPDSYLRAYAVNNRYFIKLAGKGLCHWNKNKFELLPGGERFSAETIAFLLPFPQNRLLIGTLTNGIWVYDPRTGACTRPERFQALQAVLSNDELYHGLRLPAGGYALATLSGGIYLTDAEGVLQRQINRGLGLNDNTVHFLFLDRQQGLWAAMNHGLDRISLRAPFQYWDQALGLDAAVLCIKRHHGTLYVGTNLGLYAMVQANDPSEPSRFKLVDPAHRDQIFALETIAAPGQPQTQLLLATGSGLYTLQSDNNMRRLHEADLGPFYSLAVSGTQSGVVFAGGNKGVFHISQLHQGWTIPKPIGATNLLIRSVAEDAQGRIWAGTRNRGVVCLTPDGQGGYSARTFAQMNGKPAMGDHRIFQWGERLLFRSSEFGAFQFDSTSQAFQPLYFTEDQSRNARPVWVAATGPRRNTWVWAPSANGTQLEWLIENADSNWTRVYQPFGVLPDIRDLFQGGFYTENEALAWMGGALGLYRFEAGAMPDTSYYQQAYTVLLRSVRANTDSTLIQDFHGNNATPFSLAHQLNSLAFQFAALGFECPENTLYSFLLEGYDRNWSAWSPKTEKEYTNLPPGTYRFRVRARNAFAREAHAGAFSFTILPPWYQTWWAYLLYLALFGSLLFGLVRILTRRQAQHLQREQQINEQLRNADKLKDQFLANTSHELRTPLNGIIGLSESLLDGIGSFSAEKQREELSLIISSGRRLSSLVNDLLDFSRLKDNDLQLRQTNVDLYALTDVVLQICQPLVQDKDLLLQNQVPAELAVLADEDRLQQILLNLVGNAIKFTDQGAVTVSATLHAKTDEYPAVEIEVRDTGIGIAQENQEQIFEAFNQADGSVERQFGGTGLGLAISKNLIELQGGRIWLRSEPGQGAAFFFTLPAGQKNGAPKPTPPPDPANIAPVIPVPEALQFEPQHYRKGSIRILIVDDEPINHHVLRNHLEQEPYHITNAWNGEEALRYLETEPSFDLVLLDVMMPRMSGYEVCRRIREKYLPSELPIIMITAKNQVKDLVQGLALGANDYLAKPFSKEEFLARVRTQLDLLRIFDVTARFVPNEFIRALGYERLTEVTLGDHTQREVTVLFSDIRSYTSLAENMTPEENFQFVNAYNGRMGPVIRKHNGFVNQYLGDGIMAIFPQAAEQALQAAIDMQTEIQAYNKNRRKKGQATIRVGMGLHSGPLIMGITGDEDRLDATTISDTVNTASRIESLTPYYAVNILLSEDSLQQIPQPERYRLRYLGIVQVKGRQQPVGIYECFDGDDASDIRLKLETLDQFNQAVAQFFSRNFQEASAGFQAVLARHPADTVTRLFLEKSDYFHQNGVSADWTGVEKMSGK
ncbi:MAG: response regulator [Lewinellaceae bacterium]|nr:response regulator [Saprospiraceae bacterium]MCB9330073.1 response regulator [Lewinellaceae bacterium]